MIGQIIDRRYKLVEQLDRGADSVTFLALVPETREVVDVRFMRIVNAQQNGTMDRLERQLRILNTMRHPGIVRLFAYGLFEGYPYVVAEHVSGVTLRTLLMARPDVTGPSLGLSEETTLHIALPLAGTLAYLHEQGVLHRGLCPEAVTITNDGWVRLSDFTLAKATDSPDLTHGSAMPAWGAYAAPELAQGEATPASDVFALGGLLHEMLCGSRAIGADAHPSLGAEWARLVRQCLAPDPGLRPANMGAVIAELRRLSPSDTATSTLYTPSAAGDPMLVQLVDRACTWRDTRGEPVVERAAGTPKSTGRAWLELPDGGTYAITKAGIRIGRPDPKNGIIPDLALKPGWAHRRYLRLEQRGAGWAVVLENGANHGASCNGKTLHAEQPEPISDGAQLTLGQPPNTLTLVFRYQAD